MSLRFSILVFPRSQCYLAPLHSRKVLDPACSNSKLHPNPGGCSFQRSPMFVNSYHLLGPT